MLNPQDDLLGHQLPTTFDHVASSDPRWTERYWYTGQLVADGTMIIDMGLGCYPNRNVMDAFAGVTIGTRQYNFRASRHLRPNTLEPTVGPLRFRILEGLRRHRVSLAPNESSLSFDLEYEASLPAVEEAQSFRRTKGRVMEDITRTVQFGRWRGWLEVDGRRHELEPSRWWGQRDHSWGVRSAMNTDATRPPADQLQNFLWCWCSYQFDDFGITLFLKERAPGKVMFVSGSEIRRDGTHRRLAAIEHDIRWADDPLGQTWEHAQMRLRFVDGGTRELTIEPLPGRYYLKAGMYGGLEGWNQGDDRGKLHCAHDVWNLADAQTRATARTLSDHVCRARSEGSVGSGISEYGVAAGYPLYEAPQRFPAL